MTSDAFIEFYKTTSPRTYKRALRQAAGDEQLAHDATQDAYLVMLEQWSDRSERSSEDNRRYVVAIAVRKVVDWFRRNKSLEFDPDFDAAADDLEFDNVLAQLAVLNPARTLIDCQPPSRRAVGILFFIEEIHDYREIAARLDLAESTVRNQVRRLRDRLQPLMAQISETKRGGERL